MLFRSLEIVSQVINGVNKFNRDTRRGQAAEVRKFTEARLQSTAIELRQAEEEMQRYLSTNRQISPYSELAYRRDQLQRTLMLKQQVYTNLAQSYEDVRMREVRDTPVISIVETPSVNQTPESRGRIKMVFLGLVIGATLGVLMTLLTDWLRGMSRHPDSDASEFLDLLQQIRGAVRSQFRIRRGVGDRTFDPRVDEGAGEGEDGDHPEHEGQHEARRRGVLHRKFHWRGDLNASSASRSCGRDSSSTVPTTIDQAASP